MSYQQVPLIPRSVIFGNPRRANVQVSPEGRYLSYLAPSEKDVLNVWVRSLEKEDDRMVTSDEYRGIHMYAWAYDGRHIIYIQDKDGDENFHLYATDVQAGTTRDLTPFENTRVSEIITDWRFPDQVIVGMNRRDPALFDLYRLDLQSGEIDLDTENPGDVAGWLPDREFQLRVCLAIDPANGDTVARYRKTAEDQWVEVIRSPYDENVNVLGFDTDNHHLLVTTSLGSDTDRLVRFNPDTREIAEELFHDERVDMSGFVQDPKDRRIQAVQTEYDIPEWHLLDNAIAVDFERIQDAVSGVPVVTSRSVDSRHWIVANRQEAKPSAYYHYDRDGGTVEFLFHVQPELEKYQFAPRKPVEIPTRDGWTMVGYLTEPVPGTLTAEQQPSGDPGSVDLQAGPASGRSGAGGGSTAGPTEAAGSMHTADRTRPDGSPSAAADQAQAAGLILLVHGGPWARDQWGFDALAQMLANRGYLVLQVNFRCSTGYGKSFMNAGNGEWGGKAQDDLTDAVNWAVERGLTKPDRIAIAGGSYGGYATLAGVTLTPDLYCCGVDIVGPSNLQTLLKTIPPYWSVARKQMVLRIGDVENDDEFNRARSPLFHAEKIRVPLLIGQGRNDPRVKMNESDQIVEAMRSKELPVTYVVYNDEGHGFARPENRLDFFGRMEEFLAEHMGGRCEPYEPVEGSQGELH